MGSWDRVETDFGDETRNFGPRQETGSALYEVNTIATIAQREPEKGCKKPHLCAAVVGEVTAVVANKHLSVFRELQFVQTLEFDTMIDVLEWSPDEAFLVLGDSNGSLYVVEPQSLEVIYNMSMLPPDGNGGKTFQKVVFRKTANDCYDIVILSTSSKMFVIREATPSVFMDSSKSLQELLTIEIADTSTVHTRDTHYALFLEDNIVTLGSGESIVGVWSSESGELDVVREGASILMNDAGVVCGCATSNNKFLVLLDEKNRITVMNAHLMILLSVWDEEKVESFFLLETGDKNNNSLEGVKVVMVTSTNGKNSLHVKTLPGWETVYTLKLFPTQLVESFPFQESLYIIEWCDTDENNDMVGSHLRVRCLTEALPETRLIRLVGKNRFDEAMEFAKMFNLDTELVYKAKCKYLLEQVSSWNVWNYEDSVVEQMIAELHTSLSFIKDIRDIVSLFTYVALPTMSETHKILLYVKQLMQSCLESRKDLTDIQRNKATKDLNKLMEVIHRLATFKLVYGLDTYSAEKWERFMKFNLLEETYFWFKQGELAKAVAIWNRHQHDWVSVLSVDSINNLLSVIPDSVKADQLTTWVTHDFLPFIVNTIPKAFEVLLEWLISRALNMEHLEKANWPVNAMEFLRAVHKSGLSMTYTNSGTPAETVVKTQVKITETLNSVLTQIVKLQHLYDLQEKYKFLLTYDQFEQESTESVAFRMLDKVVAIELIAPTLKKQIRPYMMVHELKEDEIFSKYIKDLLERMGRTVWYHGEAPWEAKAVAVVQYIKSSELKCEAILEVMKYASIPWTEDIHNLVQSGLKLDHPKVKLLRDQCSITRIKEILLKYELKNVKVEDLRELDLSRLLRFIVKKDGRTSVEDALEIINLKRLDHSHRLDVYLFRMRFLVEKDLAHEALSFLTTLPKYLAEKCAERMVIFAEVILNEPIRWQPEFEKRRRLQFAAVGSKFCSYLMDSLKANVTELLPSVYSINLDAPREIISTSVGYSLDCFQSRFEMAEHTSTRLEFDSIVILQTEFGEVVIMNDYRRPEQREALLKKHVQQMFADEDEGKNALCYNRLFRLAEVLQVSRAQLLNGLILHAAQKLRIDAAVDLCNMLLESDPCPETGVVLYEVAKTLCVMQDNLASLDNPPMDLLRKLPGVLSDLACQAVILCPPDLISKCLELCRATDLYNRVCGQCETRDYSGHLSEQTTDITCQDPYSVWNLDTKFREDALVLDSDLALPLASHITSAHTELVGLALCTNTDVRPEADGVPALMVDFACAVQDLITYLHKNGHLGLSLEYLRQMMATTQRCMLQHEASKLDDTLVQIFSKSLSKCKEMTCSLLLKMLNQNHVDHRLALAHLTSLPKPQSMAVLKKAASTVGHNYKMITSVAKVGIALSSLHRDPTSLAKFQELENNATWGHRLSKFKISFREAFMAACSEKTKLLPAMAQCEAIDISLIKDFCRSFQVEEDDGLLMYLDHIVLTPPPLASDHSGQEQQRAQLERAKLAVQEVKLKDQLEERLHSLLDQVNRYNYEVIEFLLEEILALSPMSKVMAEKGLELLRYLKLYRRCAPPTEEEVRCSMTQDTEELERGIDCLHPLSKDRLPYHALMSAKPHRMINPEVNYSTVAQWIPMANLLEVSSDKLYMAAIKNTVQHYKENNSSRLTAGVDSAKEKSQCNWELTEAAIDLLTKVQEMLVKMSSCETAMACCVSSVISALPVGAEKLVALEQAKSYAEKWYKATAEDSPTRDIAMTAYVKFSERYQRLSTEKILYQANMAEPHLLQLATTPEALVQKLYQHPSILQREDQLNTPRPDIHEMAENIATVNSLQLDNIVNSLITEWLPGEGGATDDQDATMTFTFTNTDFVKEESISEDEESSLRRVMYLLRHKPEELSCQFLFHYVTTSQKEGIMRTNQCLVRALRCLLELASDVTLERVCGEPAAKIRQRLQVLMYLVDLDTLNIQHTMETFTQCNKEALLKAVWQKHSHKKIAVQLVCDICLDYQVYDVILWGCVLQKLQAFGMTQKLENSLLRISGVRDLWKIPSLAKVWQELLLSYLNKGLPPLPAEQIQECAHAINLLQKCPVAEELDIAALCQQCNRVDMYACALACVAFVMDRGQQIQLVQSVMSAGLGPVLESLRLAAEQGLYVSLISQVESILFLYTDLTGSYEEMLDSDKRQAFVEHMIKEQEVFKLVDCLQNSGRVAEAGAVIDTYLEKCPTVPSHLKAACQGKSHAMKVQIFMKSA